MMRYIKLLKAYQRLLSLFNYRLLFFIYSIFLSTFPGPIRSFILKKNKNKVQRVVRSSGTHRYTDRHPVTFPEEFLLSLLIFDFRIFFLFLNWIIINCFHTFRLFSSLLLSYYSLLNFLKLNVATLVMNVNVLVNTKFR